MTIAPSPLKSISSSITSYDSLISLHHSPIVALNRAVALAMLHGPDAGIKELERINNLPQMQSYYLLPATFADFYMQKDEPQKAAEYYQQALTLAGTEPERRFLLRRLEACKKNR